MQNWQSLLSQNWQSLLSVAAIIISAGSLAVALLSLRHNRSTHLERRFGEIAGLRSKFLQRLTTVEERLKVAGFTLRGSQYDLPSLPDSKKKYEAIREATGLIQQCCDYDERSRGLRDQIESEDIENSPEALHNLQLSEVELSKLERGADKLTEVAAAWNRMLTEGRRREKAKWDALMEAAAERDSADERRRTKTQPAEDTRPADPSG
jgi:hypothetical protein